MVAAPEFLVDGPSEGPTILLAHGAGAGMDSPSLTDLANGLGAAGLRCVRFEFPYMQRRRESGGRRPPDRAPVLLDHWRSVVQEFAPAERLVIGGKSMGGRIASMLADELEVAGLVCLGYPFHPPGRPEKLRTAHLEELTTPTLILQGERDPFGRPEEVATYPLSQSIEVRWLPDGDHSLKPRKKSGFTAEGHLATVVEAMVEFTLSRLQDRGRA